MSNWGTPARTVRIDDGLWRAVKEKATTEGVPVSDIIRDFLEGWVNEAPPNAAGIKATTLREAAYDIQERGDVGKKDGPSISEYLHARAEQYLRGDRQ